MPGPALMRRSPRWETEAGDTSTLRGRAQLAQLIDAAIKEGLDLGSYEIETLTAPHEPPPRLPKDRIADYVFATPQQTLKVGLVGAGNRKRYTRYHYQPNRHQNGSLGLSIMSDPQWGKPRLTQATVGDWIKRNCERTNILLNAPKQSMSGQRPTADISRHSRYFSFVPTD